MTLVEKVAEAIENAEGQSVQGFIYPGMAKAAIATVLREMVADDSAPFTAHYFISAFARQNGVALHHIGEGKEGEKDE